MIYKRLTAKHWLSLAILAVCILFASIAPLEYPSYMLHQIGTVLMLILLFTVMRKIGLTLGSFNAYLGFLVIHVLGAHYLYSYVPYNDWAIQYFNFDLDQAMGWSRNMYDRLVHFAYGLLLYPFFLRLFQVWFPTLTPKALFFLVVQFVMATSLFYEWIEWLLAMGLSPEEAENYNGQQGDAWDAHKDMLIATFGSIITGLMMLFSSKKQTSKTK
jgi:putative membrane protein